MLALLRSPRFVIVWFGQLVNSIGDGVFAVAVGLYLAHRADAAHAVGVALAAMSIGAISSLIWGGLAADRWRPSRVIVVADLLRAGGMIALVLATGAVMTSVLSACTCLIGIGTGLHRPAYAALLRDLVRTDQVRSASRLRSLTNRAGAIVGAPLAGLVVVTASPSLALVMNAATFLVSILTLVGCPDVQPPTDDRAPESFLWEALAGFRFVRRSPWQWTIMLQGAAQIGLVVGPLAVALPILPGRTHQQLFAAIVTAEAIGSFLGALVALPRVSANQGFLAMGALLGQLPQVATIAANAPPAWQVLASGLAGVGMSVFAIIWTTALQVRTPRRVLGRVLALDAVANSAASPLGLLLAGSLRARQVLWCAAAVLVLSVVAVLGVPGVRDLGAGADTSDEPGASSRLPS